MTAATLLDRLDGVQARGEGRWMARCPAHEDRSPSLSVRETSDGTILVRCFAGCGAADVVAAVGLELKDLFPEPLTDHRRSSRRRDVSHQHAAREALRLLAHESLVALVAAENLAAGRTLSDADRARLAEAAAAIRHAREWAA